MPKEPASSESRGAPVRGTQKFRRRVLKQADGSSLILSAGGSITQVAPDGTTTQSWAPDDAEWAGQALKFGVRHQDATVGPVGLRSWEMRGPRP